MLWSQVWFLVARYLHVVCATLLVGGTLFYEMVVPVAIDDLKQEAQLAVFAKARWVFRGIVWVASALILISGAVTTARHWQSYEQGEDRVMMASATVQPGMIGKFVPVAERPGWWFAAHASVGFIAVLIALSLTIGHTPPARPVGWMRINLVILLIVIFLASAARHMRLMWSDPDAGSGRSAVTMAE
jgi:hypothetical protein